MGIEVPTLQGGQGGDPLATAIAIEEISSACATTGVVVSAHRSSCISPLQRFGSVDQRRSILAPLARGEMFGTSALAQSLCEAGRPCVVAVWDQEDHSFVLEGSVHGVVGAAYADWIAVLATENGMGTGADLRGPTAFLVSRWSGGVRAEPPELLSGGRGAHFGTVHFERCKVKPTHVLGNVGDGIAIAQTAVNSGRLAIACVAIGIARAALDESIQFVGEGDMATSPRRNSQGTSLLIADMATEVDAARMLAWRAARSCASASPSSSDCSMAKMYACEMAVRVTESAAQLHGCVGHLTTSSIERHGRDARVTDVFEGASDNQRSIVASEVLLR